ncbi:MAG TPA: efflux RND transporter periplasmic adaptor subunit, partial [Acetobacteraceae bacterium]|nr:efflux RND transporter periplasmic adaptor subunit [Acetobacteraceae bacterium]
LPNGSAYDQSGKITFIDNQVDPATGTITIWADFANPQRLLIPGAYVTVEVRRAKPEEKPMVPVAAAQTDQKGSYVLLVGPGDKVKQQPVTLGRQVAQNFIVDKGLSGGEQVIVQGMQKVRPGEVVKPVAQPPANQTASQGAAAGQQGG